MIKNLVYRGLNLFQKLENCRTFAILNNLRLNMDEKDVNEKDGFVEVHNSAEEEPSTSQSAGKPKITLAAKFSKPFKPMKAKRTLENVEDSHSKKSRDKKKPPMRTALDVINRIKYDDTLSPEDFSVGYEDRFDGVVEKLFSEFDWDAEIAGCGPDVMCIPQHRIQYFKQHGTVVWDKKSRLDNVFGSTEGSVKISELNIAPNSDNDHTDDKISDQHVLDVQTEQTHTIHKYNENRGFIHPDSRKPNCFIGLVVDSPKVIGSVTAYHKKLLAMAKQVNVESQMHMACVPREKLHITLCVCGIDPEDLPMVKEVTNTLFAEKPAIHVEFKGIGKFGENVVYTVPHSSALCQYANFLQDMLANAGINMEGNYKPYRPHLTLVKSRGVPPQPVVEILNHKSFAKWNFKGQLLNQVVICEIRTTAPDGFYNTLASYQLKESFSPQNYMTTSQVMNKRYQKHQKQNNKVKNSKHSSKKDQDRDVQIGKSLAAVLRHNKFGFEVDSAGFVEVDAILAHQQFGKSLRATRDDIHRVVNNNDKRRFEIVVDETGVERIRATQGHSVQVEDLELQEITDPSEYPNVVHGTFWKFWQSISCQGLHRRKRIHIHMTTAEPNDPNTVISGMRKSCNVFVYIDIASAMADGLRFFVSSNGVILSPGDDMGYIAPKYFTTVVGTSKNHRICLLDKSHPPTYEEHEVDAAQVCLENKETRYHETDKPEGAQSSVGETHNGNDDYSVTGPTSVEDVNQIELSQTSDNSEATPDVQTSAKDEVNVNDGVQKNDSVGSKYVENATIDQSCSDNTEKSDKGEHENVDLQKIVTENSGTEVQEDIKEVTNSETGQLSPILKTENEEDKADPRTSCKEISSTEAKPNL